MERDTDSTSVRPSVCPYVTHWYRSRNGSANHNQHYRVGYRDSSFHILNFNFNFNDLRFTLLTYS